MHTNDPSYVLRIDKATGKTIWRVERPTKAIRESPDAYTTPALVTYNSSTEIVITGGDVATGHDPATGKELWRVDGLNPSNDSSYRLVASPIVVGDMIFVPSRERPILAIRAGGRGDVTRSHVVWSFNSGPDVPTPVTDGQYFYVVRDNGVMFCLDAKTGKTIYGPVRLPSATYSGSPVLADGKIYVTNEDGVTSVVRKPFAEGAVVHALQDAVIGRRRRTSRAAIGELLGLLGYPEDWSGELEQAAYNRGLVWRLSSPPETER